MAEDDLERAIAGALRSAIHDHGPITAEKIGSAAKRIVGSLKNARLAGMAAAMGRRGGLARKRAGADFAAVGAKGGAAGKGVKKPRSEAAKRTMLARRILRAADESGSIEADRMRLLAPGRPELHKNTSAQTAAKDLGVVAELRELQRA